MATSTKWFANGLKQVAAGSINWTADTIKVAAVSAAYTPDQAAHDFFDDVSANELPTANGYTAGGAALGTKSVGLAGLVASLRAAATVWTPGVGETLSIRYLVIYKVGGSAATSPLLGYVDLGATISATNAAWTSTWDATDGALKITAA